MPDRENVPAWLNAVLGESPLLTDPEWEFIADMRSSILEEIKLENRISCGNGDGSLKEKLSIMKDNFMRVVKHLKTNYSHRHYFIGVYLKWRLLRDYNIKYLRKIADSVEDTRQKCQVANVIGSCLSLIGGGVSLVATMKSNRLGQINGGAMMGIGTLTCAGSSVAEVGLLYHKVKEAEKVLQEDKEASEHLWDWLSDSSALQRATEDIRYIDVEMNMKFAANLFQNSFKKKRDDTEVQKYVRRVTDLLNVPSEFAEEVADIIGILMATSMLYDRYRPLFDLAFAGFKFSRQLRASVDLFRAAVAVSAVGNRSVGTETTETQLAAAMVLDLANIFLVCKDFRSESKQATVITKAAVMLEKEAEVFERLYTEIKDLDVEAL